MPWRGSDMPWRSCREAGKKFFMILWPVRGEGRGRREAFTKEVRIFFLQPCTGFVDI